MYHQPQRNNTEKEGGKKRQDIRIDINRMMEKEGEGGYDSTYPVWGIRAEDLVWPVEVSRMKQNGGNFRAHAATQ